MLQNLDLDCRPDYQNKFSFAQDLIWAYQILHVVDSNAEFAWT